MMFRRVILVGLLIALAAAGEPSRSAGALETGGPDPEHPFSEPIWWPLRTSARVDCVTTNCPGPLHGYEAIDISGDFGDPVYAAGAGILHIGNIDPSCPVDGPTVGTWVWIDHGPAGRTRYGHLDSVEAVEGQLVTPRTMIGTMGNSGSKFPCAGAYLHIEYRTAASNETRLPLPDLHACVGGVTLRYPKDLGHSEWDDIPAGPTPDGPRVHTPDSDNSCFPSSWSLTPDQPTAVLEPDVEQLKVALSARAGGVNDVRVRLEQYHPTISRFGSAIDRTLPPTQNTTTFRGLIPGKTYRVQVSFHNDAGWSAWSDPVVGEPGRPVVPPLLREIESTRSSIKYKWHRTPNADAGYDVRIRRASGSTWGAWTRHPVTAPAINYRFADLDLGVKYQVTVRARNEFATSDWAPAQTITTLGCESTCEGRLQVAVRLNLVSPAA
ncbi:MAG: murein DD-endopeptidase MepM/ murein hydrolase activator NlpD [Ilumatobacter sp.]|jgi:murein DD-endopeptidase MepM/ murein hydrolase activator NlpD